MPGKKKKARGSDEPSAKKISMRPLEESSYDYINTLNDDCLSNIFEYLTIKDRLTIRKVCRRWRMNRQLVWGGMKTLSFKKPSDDSSPLVWWRNSKFWEEVFKESQSFLRKLEFNYLDSHVILSPIVKYCQNLTRLVIALPARDINFIPCFSRMEKLEYLKISGSRLNFSDEFFNRLPRQNLTELHLIVYYEGVIVRYKIPRSSHNALEKLKNLTSLSLENFCLEPKMLEIINNMTNLISLSLQSCTCTKSLPHLNLPSLQHLNLYDVRRANDQFVSRLCEDCKNLKSLDLSRCHGLTDKGVNELKKLPKLEELSLVGLNNITDKPLSTMYNLRKLDCMMSKNVGDSGIITLARNSQKLEEVTLFETGVSYEVNKEVYKIIRERITRNTVIS